MTVTLAFLSLGTSPLTGKAAVDQAVTFKRQLRSVLPFEDNASLLLCVDPETQRCEVRIAYDRTNEQATAWAKLAQEISGEIWSTLAERRIGRNETRNSR